MDGNDFFETPLLPTALLGREKTAELRSEVNGRFDFFFSLSENDCSSFLRFQHISEVINSEFSTSYFTFYFSLND
jgi:hypothetical protein